MTTDFHVTVTYESEEYTFTVEVKPTFDLPDDFVTSYEIQVGDAWEFVLPDTSHVNNLEVVYTKI